LLIVWVEVLAIYFSGVDAARTKAVFQWDKDASDNGYVGAARMQVNLISDPGTAVLQADASGDLLDIDSSGDNMQVASGLPFDVPCQLLGFDLVYEPGGQV
jgi:hypothetical protein